MLDGVQGKIARRSTVRVAIGSLIAAALVFCAWPNGPVREAAHAYRTSFVCWEPSAKPDQVRTVALGDSITAGEHRDMLLANSSTSYFDVATCDRDSPIGFAANAGVWQNTTAQMLERLDSDVVSRSPELVLVLGGTNDIRLGQGDRTVENLAAIRQRLDAEGIAAMFALVPPSDEFPAETDALNDAIAAWAAAEDVPLLDFHSPLADADGTYREGQSIDGIHPSEAAAGVLAAVAESAVRGGPLHSP